MQTWYMMMVMVEDLLVVDFLSSEIRNGVVDVIEVII
jgi:hypothetical protein